MQHDFMVRSTGNFRNKRNFWKRSPVFPVETSKRRIFVPFTDFSSLSPFRRGLLSSQASLGSLEWNLWQMERAHPKRKFRSQWKFSEFFFSLQMESAPAHAQASVSFHQVFHIWDICIRTFAHSEWSQKILHFISLSRQRSLPIAKELQILI